jgi:hypothetical protein
MDRPALEGLLQSSTLTAGDLLARTELDELDDVLVLLARCRPLGEVRAALLERIAAAPLQEFNLLKIAHFRHFAAREH